MSKETFEIKIVKSDIEKTYSLEVIKDAIELYQVIINNPVTVDMLKLVGERCSLYGYTYKDLEKLLKPLDLEK